MEERLEHFDSATPRRHTRQTVDIRSTAKHPGSLDTIANACDELRADVLQQADLREPAGYAKDESGGGS